MDQYKYQVYTIAALTHIIQDELYQGTVIEDVINHFLIANNFSQEELDKILIACEQWIYGAKTRTIWTKNE